MRIKLTVEYDGTSFCGWQVQPNGRSVQGEIETAVYKLTGETVRITGSGRTDSGVHAKGQVAHFDTTSTIPPEKFAFALNTFLPSDVSVISSALVDNNFHARYSAKEKTYVYSFYVSDVVRPTYERFSTRVDAFDVKKAKEIASAIVGEHDFKCFCKADTDVTTTVRKVYSIEFYKIDDRIDMEITGNGFLYNMVRMIAGAVKAYLDGKISVSDIEDAFLTGEKVNFVATMPAKGLTLKSVVYK